MSQKDLRDLLPLPEPAAAFLEASQLAVAAAVRDETPRVGEIELELARRYIDQAGLFASVGELWQAVPEEWDFPLLALLATDNPWVDLEDLTHGSLHRRVDALFDMFDTDFCAHEVQSYFLELVEDVRAWAQDPTKAVLRSTATFTASFAGAFAGGYVGVPSAGIYASKAASWLFDDSSAPSDFILDLSRFVMTYDLLPGDEDRLTSPETDMLRAATAQLEASSGDLSESGPSAERLERYRGWLAVTKAIGARNDGAESLPSLTNMTMAEARTVAAGLGQELAWVDVARDSGFERTPWRESGWRIVAQSPQQGEDLRADRRICIAIVKLGERPVGDPATRIEAAIKPPTQTDGESLFD